MSSAWLATYLDYQMLETAGVVVDRQRRAGMPDLPLRRGADVAKELAGRFLLHYVTSANVGRYRPGRADRCFVTPTPFSPADTGAWLALPGANIPRQFVLLLEPRAIPWIQGPMVAAFASAIQYVLPHGFPADAIVVAGAPGEQWEHVVH